MRENEVRSFALRSVADVVQAFPQSIAVFESAGVDFSCKGAQSMANAATAAGYDVLDLLLLIEASTGPRESVEWMRRPLSELTHYLAKDHADLAGRRLPAVRELLEGFAALHPSLKELRRVRALLSSFAADLMVHMAQEERDLFPRIEAHDLPSFTPGTERIGQLVLRELVEHEGLRERLRVMREVCCRIRAECAGEILSEIESLSRALHYHMHLENNVLCPRALEDENALRHLGSLDGPEC